MREGRRSPRTVMGRRRVSCTYPLTCPLCFAHFCLSYLRCIKTFDSLQTATNVAVPVHLRILSTRAVYLPPSEGCVSRRRRTFTEPRHPHRRCRKGTERLNTEGE